MKHSLKIVGLLTATVLTILLASQCGGGGGDSTPAVQPIAYTGITEAAAITLTNTPTLVANVLFGGTTTADIPAGVEVSDNIALPGNLATSADHLVSVYHNSLDNIIGTVTHGFNIPASVEINDTVQCEIGFYTVQGTLDDITKTGTLAFNYHACLRDGVTRDGSLYFHVHYNDPYRLNTTMDMVLLRVSSSKYDVSVSGTLAIDEMLSGNAYTEQKTRNYVMKANTTGRMYMYENYVITTHTNDIFSSTSGGYISYTGAPVAVIYDSVYGSLKVESIDPLLFSSTLIPYPDEGGKLLFTGSNSSIQLSVLSQRHVKLELDIDGSTGYEILRYVLWGELEDVANLNLADSDGDGMHDSWESRFGLNPLVDDSAGNLDGDALTNIEEYQQGYDPGNPLSPSP